MNDEWRGAKCAQSGMNPGFGPLNEHAATSLECIHTWAYRRESNKSDIRRPVLVSSLRLQQVKSCSVPFVPRGKRPSKGSVYGFETGENIHLLNPLSQPMLLHSLWQRDEHKDMAMLVRDCGIHRNFLNYTSI
ncbi:MAG TPA: hypothetical protein VLA19_10490 [Herpetosiphonaceae bacterium]|nr:hypothetical protein [Herpetosiphonaceae bacterium]